MERRAGGLLLLLFVLDGLGTAQAFLASAPRSGVHAPGSGLRPATSRTRGRSEGKLKVDMSLIPGDDIAAKTFGAMFLAGNAFYLSQLLPGSVEQKEAPDAFNMLRGNSVLRATDGSEIEVTETWNYAGDEKAVVVFLRSFG